MSEALQEALMPHYVRLAFGGHITMPDGLDYTYADLAHLVGNGRELTFAQFVDWAHGYMEQPHQMRLEVD